MAYSSVSSHLAPLYILGAGNIGLFFATSLTIKVGNKYPVRLLLRPKHKPRLMLDEHKNQVINTSLLQKGNVEKVSLQSEIIGQHKSDRLIEKLLLTTKAADAAKAFDSIKDRLAPDAKIIIMTNGAFAVKEELEEVLSLYDSHNLSQGKPKLILASTTHGVHRHHDDDSMVIHAGIGQAFVNIFPQHENCQNSIKQINEFILFSNQAELNMKGLNEKEMYVLQWKKLAANCAINPLTALLRCCNGHLLDENFSSKTQYQNIHIDEPKKTMYNIIREVSEVAQLSSVYDDKHELTYDALVDFVHCVIQDTAKNKSSMLQDFLHQRTSTEIQYLNGYVARIGHERFNLSMSTNILICSEIDKLSKVMATKRCFHTMEIR